MALLAIGSVLIAGAVDPNAVPAAQAAAPQQQMPPPRQLPFDKNSALILIRSSLIALQQANQTGNYSVLYALSAPGFQKVNSPERLSEVFANLRKKNFDLSGVVVLEPQLTVLPLLYANGTMRMSGFFPSVPMQVLFDLQFAAVQGQWKLIAITVDVAGATPAAPTPNPALAASYSPSPTLTPTPPVTSTATPNPAPKPAVKESQSVEGNVKPKRSPKPTPESMTPSPTPTPTPSPTPKAKPKRSPKITPR
jgi:hypothetical protein